LSLCPDHESQTYIAEKGLSNLRWTRKNIVEEIKRLHAEEVELNYSSVEANHLYLVRAASWHFGTWRRAIESAGFEYESLSKYQRWDRERIVARIRELHAQGVDLSWRVISQEVDPRLAAAALRVNGFESWRDAIAAAGFDIEEVARYKSWTAERVLREIKAHHKAGQLLSSKAMQDVDQSLFCAARRRFGSWDNALAAAGFDAAKIRLRHRGEKKQKDEPRAKAAAKPVAKAVIRRAGVASTAGSGGTSTRTARTTKIASTTPKRAPQPLKKLGGAARATGKRLAAAGASRAR